MKGQGRCQALPLYTILRILTQRERQGVSLNHSSVSLAGPLIILRRGSDSRSTQQEGVIQLTTLLLISSAFSQRTQKATKAHLAFDQIPMSLAIHFFIIQKHTVLGSGTHEVIVAGAGCKAATHSGSWLLAEFTSLTIQKEQSLSQTFRCFSHSPSSLRNDP